MNPYSESQKPEFCPVKNTDTIVIFIHGIVEGPAQFKDLMKLTIQHGYSAVSLLLPGHGGTGKDFARSSGDQWIDYTRTQINLYKQQYDKIILVGHSMGTLLSFIAYAENPGQITGIVAIDSPLHVSVKWLAIKNNLKIGFSKKISENDPAQALLHASSVAPCSLFTYLTWAPRIIDLFRLMKQTRKLLHCVAVPTLVIHADKDELVSSFPTYDIHKISSIDPVAGIHSFRIWRRGPKNLPQSILRFFEFPIHCLLLIYSSAKKDGLK